MIVSIQGEENRRRLSRRINSLYAPINYDITANDEFKIHKFTEEGGLLESIGPDGEKHLGPQGVALRFYSPTSEWFVREAGIRKKKRKRRKSKRRKSKRRKSKRRKSKRRRSKRKT
jgi:hypothetical protein